MTQLADHALELEKQIEAASQKERLALLPAFDRVIATLTAHGETVPGRLRRLNSTLKEEAIEDLFDNMPI